MKIVAVLLWPARFTILVLLAVWVVLLLVGQAQDVLYSLIADEGGTGRKLWFLAGLWAWAIQSWYWTRLLFYLPSRPMPQCLYILAPSDYSDFLDALLPRLLGVGPFVAVATSLLFCGPWEETLPWAGFLLGNGLIFYTLTAVRRYWLNGAQQGGPRGQTGLQRAHGVPRHATGTLAQQPGAALQGSGMPSGWPSPKAGTLQTVGIAVVAWSVAVVAVALTAFLPAETPIVRPLLVGLLVTTSAAGVLCLLWRLNIGTGTRRAVAILLLLTLASFVVSLLAPVPVGTAIGPGGALMLAAAAWVGTSSFFLAYPGERLRLPVTLLLLVLTTFGAGIGEFWGHDHHEVRLLPASGPAPEARQTLKALFDEWYAQAPCPGPGSNLTNCWEKPMILVAAEGGASRSAFWTATVLGDLEDMHPGFHKRIFALSGVSGGSLGVTVYRQLLLSGGGKGPSCVDRDGHPAEGFGRCAQAILGTDFLGPTFFRLFHTDLMHWLLPGNLLPDRAAALEEAWEQAWDDRMKEEAKGAFDKPFVRPSGPGWSPLLLLNGASVKTGRRIVTSDALLTPCPGLDGAERGSHASDLPDTVDFHCLVNRPVRVSTAVHNSARFPYVSPAGTIWVSGHKADRIVDGGYVEALGASTLFDLLPGIRAAAKVPDMPSRVRIVVLVIKNAPPPPLPKGSTRRPPLVEAIGDEAEAMRWSMKLSPELLSPPMGLAASRGGRGTAAGASLEREVLAGQGAHIRFNLRSRDEAERWADPAMSWFLSERSLRDMWNDWCDQQDKTKPERGKGNADYLRDLGLAIDGVPWAVDQSAGVCFDWHSRMMARR
ncbi:hypothetical protein [Azospirillum lipoferum]|nr:hypothetical protein [Azospirillum lipoferum]